MKRMHKYLLVAGAMAVSACAEKEDAGCPCGNTGTPDCVYVSAELSLAGSGTARETRSSTEVPDDGYAASSDGTEPGKAGETAVSEVLLVIADLNNENMAAALLEDAGSSLEYTIPIPFRYLKGHEGEQVRVFVFCNPSAELKSLAGTTPQGELPKDFADKIYEIEDPLTDRAWEEGSFMMSNAELYTTVLPDDWSGYRSVAAPFPLTQNGPVPVERSVARFDYKAVRTDNIYPVSYDKANPSATENPGIMVQLTDAAFVNIGKQFYYLRRVADEGMQNISLCGSETPDNYVIDPDAEAKMHVSEGWINKTDHYFCNLEEPETWSWTSLSSIASAGEDNVWGGDTEDTKGFHIWRYMTENTAPSIFSQVESISTSIVFKGKIIPGDGCPPEIEEVLAAGTEPVYLWDGILYGTWEMTGAAGSTDEPLRVAWQAVEKNGESLEDAGFTEIVPENGIYACRYYYMNRHNDNGSDDPEDPDYLSPMKFAVVRNNVYKLSIDAVFGFGQGELPEEETFLMTTVKVLPWVEHRYTITIDENS